MYDVNTYHRHDITVIPVQAEPSPLTAASHTDEQSISTFLEGISIEAVIQWRIDR